MGWDMRTGWSQLETLPIPLNISDPQPRMLTYLTVEVLGSRDK